MPPARTLFSAGFIVFEALSHVFEFGYAWKLHRVNCPFLAAHHLHSRVLTTTLNASRRIQCSAHSPHLQRGYQRIWLPHGVVRPSLRFHFLHHRRTADFSLPLAFGAGCCVELVTAFGDGTGRPGRCYPVHSFGEVLAARMSEHVRGVTGKHRNPTELQAALKVINDQLVDANDVERPALELVAQKLTEQLLEVELEEEGKQERQCGEEAKRPPCRESEHLGGHSPASSAAPAGDVPAAQEPSPVAQKQRTEEGSGKDSERDDEWKAFLKDLPRVLIANGTQKYVLIRISPEQNPNKHLENSIYLVRGNPAVEYHYQCALETMKELESMGAEGEILGGGRIECRMKEKEVEIYGHSYQFGRADHAVTAQLIKDAFGSDFQVSWGDYGY